MEEQPDPIVALEDQISEAENLIYDAQVVAQQSVRCIEIAEEDFRQTEAQYTFNKTMYDHMKKTDLVDIKEFAKVKQTLAAITDKRAQIREYIAIEQSKIKQININEQSILNEIKTLQTSLEKAKNKRRANTVNFK